jgi:hypothetical protein
MINQKNKNTRLYTGIFIPFFILREKAKGIWTVGRPGGPQRVALARRISLARDQ